MNQGTQAVGFEAMPRVADPEIAATWDEIELKAALRDRGAAVRSASSAQTASSLSKALRAIEELQRLPKAERKRRAEELLRTLTSAPPIATPEPESPANPSEPILQPSPAEPVAESPEISEPVVEWPEILRLVALPGAEPVASTSPEISGPKAVELPSTETAAGTSEVTETLAQAAASPETAQARPEIAGPVSEEPPAATVPETAEPMVPEPARELEPNRSAPITAVATTDDRAAETATNAQVVEPLPEVAPEASRLPAAAATAEPYPIPKFLTEGPSLEPERPDRLILFRAAAAACVAIGAVLLIYFGSAREVGVAARPILGASEPVERRAAPPEIPPSVAVRQAFVAAPLAYSAASVPLRSYRPPFVGFDFLEDAAPPPLAAKAEPPAPRAAPSAAIPTQAEVLPDPPAPQAAPPAAIPTQAEIALDPPVEHPIVPLSPAEETAALPPPADADLGALIRRGDALLKAGDIVAARAAYERAAAGGSVKAQIGLGMTYDPLVLAKLGARGVRGDPVQAASWYARAGEAGDEEGQQRLHALISGLSDCMLAQGACAARKP